MNSHTLYQVRAPALAAWGCVALLASSTFVSAAASETGTTLPLKNPGMEEGNEAPAAWQKSPAIPGVVLTWDRSTSHEGKASLCLKKTAQRYFPIASWSQSSSVEPASEVRKLRVRCWVKAEAVTKAIIDVPYRVGDRPETAKPGHVWAVYVGQKQPTDPLATHDWRLYNATIQIPAKASEVGIAFQIYGPGTVWFDDLEVAWIE